MKVAAMRRVSGYLPSLVFVAWAVMTAGFGNVAAVWVLLMCVALVVTGNELRKRYRP